MRKALERYINDHEIQGLVIASLVIIGAFLLGRGLQIAVEYITTPAAAAPRIVPVVPIKPRIIRVPMLIREGVQHCEQREANWIDYGAKWAFQPIMATAIVIEPDKAIRRTHPLKASAPFKRPSFELP